MKKTAKTKYPYMYITVAVKEPELQEWINELNDKCTNISAYVKDLIIKDMKLQKDCKAQVEAILNGTQDTFHF